ncbi:trypsin-like peptidase domain-containing protein [Dactylosporangium sp. CS-047395]|uniref:trypsin-like peptidase domain-containing protein n=1 Tax=Dactylosporangium sp. CS-047395 TaxID=3239936 RepID=UPI003D9230A0
MDELPGPLLAELIERLATAYRNRTDLALALLRANVHIDDFATPRDPARTVLTELFGQGDGVWQREIAAILVAGRPRHRDLAAWAAEHGLATAAEPVPVPAAMATSLERTVREGEPRVDVDAFITGFDALRSRVCRVQLVGAHVEPLGTGFLIGPDLCLTNHHVVAPVIEGRRRPQELRLLFDFQVVDQLHRPGVLFELAEDWLVARSPSSLADTVDDPAAEPDPRQADLAVLRTRARPGDTVLIGRGGEERRRGWFTEIRRDPLPESGSLYLLQHAGQEPLTSSFGRSLGANRSGTRLRHAMNTAPGSSGGPVLDPQGRLVGIHVAGDPRRDDRPARFNVAVPIAAIRTALRGQPVDADILSTS